MCPSHYHLKDKEETKMLEDRAVRNKIRHTVLKAEKEEIITQEEVAFIVSIIEKGRKEIDKKVSELNALKGQILQLKESGALMKDARKGDKKLNIEGILAQKFVGQLETKEIKRDMLRGQIAQLRSNEQAIMGLIENLIKAKERDIARQETHDKLRAAREVENERHRKRKNALLKEQGDTASDTKKDVADKAGTHVPKDK